MEWDDVRWEEAWNGVMKMGGGHGMMGRREDGKMVWGDGRRAGLRRRWGGGLG